MIINSLPNMKYSWGEVRKKCEVKNPFKDYEKFIGLEFYDILNNLKIKKKYYSNIKKIYSRSSVKSFDRIKLYPNVYETLKLLQKKYKLAILTSKDRVRTKKFLNKLLPKIKFSSIQSPQINFRPKPFSDLMLKIIAENNVNLNNVLYIGDSYYDLKMAKSSKVSFLFASYGYSKIKNPIKKIKSFKELLKLID